MVDAEDAELRCLPWEVLSLGDGPYESTAGGLVARWAAGTPGTAEPGATFALWTARSGPGADRSSRRGHRMAVVLVPRDLVIDWSLDAEHRWEPVRDAIGHLPVYSIQL